MRGGLELANRQGAPSATTRRGPHVSRQPTAESGAVLRTLVARHDADDWCQEGAMVPTAASYRVVSRRDSSAFTERDCDCTVVWLRGEHDASTVSALWETIDQAIALDDSDVVVDLSGVEFMGSATVGVIIRARESLRPRARALTLRSPSRCAQRLLDLYGLAELIDV